VQRAGLEVLATTEATQTWDRWDPDESPAPAGCFSMRSLAEDLVAAGRIGGDEADHFVATTHEAARRGRFTMALTMYAVVAASSR
jgi:hypothetical protein